MGASQKRTRKYGTALVHYTCKLHETVELFPSPGGRLGRSLNWAILEKGSTRGLLLLRTPTHEGSTYNSSKRKDSQRLEKEKKKQFNIHFLSKYKKIVLGEPSSSTRVGMPFCHPVIPSLAYLLLINA